LLILLEKTLVETVAKKVETIKTLLTSEDEEEITELKDDIDGQLELITTSSEFFGSIVKKNSTFFYSFIY